jgi:hypothetical protein
MTRNVFFTEIQWQKGEQVKSFSELIKYKPEQGEPPIVVGIEFQIFQVLQILVCIYGFLGITSLIDSSVAESPRKKRF